MQCLGEASVRLKKGVEIISSASVVGTKEGRGPLGALFDKVGKDDAFGAKTWEEAESTLQRQALAHALSKAGMRAQDVRCLIAGDLLGQEMASSFGLGSFRIPMFGVYGACSTCGEALTLAAMMIDGGYADVVACVTSSHFAAAEREFRFPLEYGNQRPLSASWTVTGSGAFILRGERQKAHLSEKNIAHHSERNHVEDMQEESGRDETQALAQITGMTVGRIVDFGLKDSMNMGACMAPAAADTVMRHFQDFGSGPAEYDHVITGDLGSFGRRAFLDILRDKGLDLEEKHLDCGMLIYDAKSQDVHAGGSGCGCCAVTLSAFILKQLHEGDWHRILFLPTGALLSKTSFNEGKSVPGICHAVVLESPRRN